MTGRAEMLRPVPVALVSSPKQVEHVVHDWVDLLEENGKRLGAACWVCGVQWIENWQHPERDQRAALEFSADRWRFAALYQPWSGRLRRVDGRRW